MGCPPPPILPTPLASDQTEARKSWRTTLRETVAGSLQLGGHPALGLAEQDRHRNELDEETQNFIYQSTREIIEDLPIASAESLGEGPWSAPGLSPDGLEPQD
jgi:hypothetical protein